MNKKLIKILLSVCALSTLSIFYLTNTKEKVNTNVATSIDSSINSEGYQGKLSDMPSEYMTESINEYLAENPESADSSQIIVMNEDALTSYTYKDAPDDLRLEYEKNCAAIGKIPCDDDPIIVKNK